MPTPEAQYVRRQLAHHFRLFFDQRVNDLFATDLIRFVPQSQVEDASESAIYIPCDLPATTEPVQPYRIPFANTELTLWNRLPAPETGNWEGIPNALTPLWYRNKAGACIPAWNLFGNIFGLLTHAEESHIKKRDYHGRFAAALSPRADHDLLEVPAVNEAAAALAAAMVGLADSGSPRFDLDDLVKPPVIVPSHDCDILYGNDFWTQAARLARIPTPLKRLKWPRLENLWWIARNAVTPRRFYFENIDGMIDLERTFGFTSTFYMLNGTGGRFGSRSGISGVADALTHIPPAWDIGMHYNYDTFLDPNRFSAQKDELEQSVGTSISVGRAHYLKFDPAESYPFLAEHGIRVDESSGYPDRIGYRNGLAGIFQPFDQQAGQALDLYEIPMIVMDAVIVRQYGNRAIEVFASMMRHLAKIGGAMTVIFHPGQFFNPEYPEMLGIYHRMLIECRRVRATSATARSLAEQTLTHA